MITEDYVSFELGKPLKEKGFDGKCKGFYSLKENHVGEFSLENLVK